MPPERNLVLAVGGKSFAHYAFEKRELSVLEKTSEEAKIFFGNARAVIVSEQAGDIAKYKKHFYDILSLAEQHGLALVVFVHPSDMDAVTLIKTEMVTEHKIGRTVEIYACNKVVEAAEAVRRAYVNPFQRSMPTIDKIDKVTLSAEWEILLRRSFFDCKRIRLKPLDGGKASDAVFLVEAWCNAENIGTRPLPFFVKFGKPSSIERERQNYRKYAQLYVPFNLRPNLDQHRCVRGSKYSALVGNFVEDSVALREALRKGVGDGVLFSLFETSLKAFRSQAFTGTGRKREKGLDTFLKKRVAGRNGNRMIENVEEGAKILTLTGTLGRAINAKELEARLYKAAETMPHWWVPIHGDLHSGNVMVRRDDSILIDFGSVDDGPLTADPATLEVSLIFGTDEHDNPQAFEEWKAFVDNAYLCAPGIRPPNPSSEPTEFDWLRQSIRELRHILFGCDCHDTEAELVLAAYLMRFASLDIEKLPDEGLRNLALKRRAYALITAERLVSEAERPRMTISTE